MGKVACDVAIAGVSIAANILLLLASQNNPAAPAVAEVDVIIVSAVAGVPAVVVVLTAADVPGAPAVAKISAVAAVTKYCC